MKGIKKIKDGLISRQVAMAKLAFKTGTGVLLSGDSDLKARLKNGLEGQLDTIVTELGLMKGSLMKAGQMLSMYSGAFLSPEAQKILKVLENQSHFLEWEAISKRIPSAWTKDLDINPIPLAAASLGQVHLATPKDGSAPFAMKIQYEGVRRAIDNDLRSLRWLFKALGVLPKELNLDEVFEEIREMLIQETSYTEEKNTVQTFSKLLNQYPQYEIPDVIEQFSNDTILSTRYLLGVSPKSLEIKTLPQATRDELGKEFMRLFFLEIFHWGVIQTDPHAGNYLILNHEQKPRWGLLDFGATKKPPKEFLLSYQDLILSCAKGNRELYFETIKKMGYLSDSKDSNTELLWEYSELLSAPFQNGIYDWGNSSIPDQVFKYMPRLMREVSLGRPPRHAIFIDRKIAGVFFMLRELGAKIDARKLLDEYSMDH